MGHYEDFWWEIDAEILLFFRKALEKIKNIKLL